MKRKTKHAVPVTGTIRVRVYPLICDAVDIGVTRGWRRAHKHDDAPGEDAILTAIGEAVLGELCERLRFDDYPDGG